MLDFIRAFLDGDSLSPHGICLLWRPELIWTHVVADTLIGLAYFSIPIVLAVFVSKRRDVAFGWVFWCFAAFILACGTTHFFSIWTLWNPDYALEAVIKAATAGISVVTAAALWPLLPRALALPSPAQLKAANDALVLTLAERDAALEALHRETAERLRAEDMLPPGPEDGGARPAHRGRRPRLQQPAHRGDREPGARRAAHGPRGRRTCARRWPTP
jgi:hypothetical protein